MASVVLQGVSKVFPPSVLAIRNLDLTVEDGELVVLVGPSGCGKTTTLRLIAGLDDVTRGIIRIDGQAVNGCAPRDRNISMVFQDGALYPHLTVYKNLVFGLSLRRSPGWLSRWWLPWPNSSGPSRTTTVEKVLSVSRMLGLEHLLDRKPRQLSGGERQRVALGRAIVRQPAAFLLDEPLSKLEAPLRAQMRRELRVLHQRLQSTMVYVTHDQVEAMTLGDRIVVLDRGSVQQVGTPTEIYEQPKNLFVAGFFGSVPMNLVHGRMQQDGDQWRFEGGGLAVRRKDTLTKRGWERLPKNVILGIRPEHVHVGPLRDDGLAANIGGLVTLSERFGHDTLMTLTVGNQGPIHGEPTSYNKTFYNKTLCNCTCDNSHDTGNASASLTCVVPTDMAAETGTQVEIRIDASRTLWFDALTGENLQWNGANDESQRRQR